jgi:excisionase family DNA binding protein
MEALVEKTTREEQRIAKGSLDIFYKLLRSSESKSKAIKITFPDSDEPITLPAKVLGMMEEILSGMSIGRSMAVIQTEMEVSTQEAANFLEVSRPHVVRLLEKGEIPFTKAGTHRRIKMSDLIAYQKALKATRKKQMKFLAKQAQELNLDY